MADKTPAPLTDPAPPDAPEGFWRQLDQHISDALGKLFDSGRATVTEGTPAAAAKGDPAKPPPVDVEGQVKTAVQDVLSARQKQDAADAEKTALKAEVDRLKSLVEKPPREFKAVTRFMWGDDDG